MRICVCPLVALILGVGSTVAYADVLDVYSPADHADSAPSALLLRSPASQPRAVDLALIVDLSASQTGAHRSDTLRIVSEIVSQLRGGSRCQLWTTPASASIMDEPAAVGSVAVKEALTRLASIPSLGAADLHAAFRQVEAWLAHKEEGLPKAVLYVGDGVSAASPVTASDWNRWRSLLIDQKTPFFVLSSNASLDGSSIGLLADRTGGVVLDAPPSHSEDISKRMVESLVSPIVWNAEIQGAGVSEVLPKPLPPIRSDRDSLIMAICSPTASSLRLTGVSGGRSVHADFTMKRQSRDSQELSRLHQAFVAHPTAGVAGDGNRILDVAFRRTAKPSDDPLASAHSLLTMGEPRRAAEIYERVLAVEPGDPEAVLGLRVARRLQTEPHRATATAPVQPVTERTADAVAPPLATHDLERDPIEEAKARAQIEAQRLSRAVGEALRRADQLHRTDPDGAIRLLKQTLLTIEGASENDPVAMVPLARRIEQKLRSISGARRRAEIERIERDRVVSQSESRRRQESADELRELTTKELVNRFNQLLAVGEAPEAVAVSKELLAKRPDSPIGIAAVSRSQFADRYRQVESVELARQDQWWWTLQEVERSAIPFPDDLTIRYPSAKEWEELTIRREKYRQGVDLAPVSPAEADIRKALSRPISFDFAEMPIQDVAAFIHDFAKFNVVLDRNGLEQANITADFPITLTLENVSLKSALKLLLEPLDLTYVVRDDVLLITNTASAEKMMTTKVYPVADLVIPIPNLGGQSGGGANGVGVNVGVNNGANRGGGIQAGQNAVPNLGVGPRATPSIGKPLGESKLQELKKLIEQTVSPNDWDALLESRPNAKSVVRPAIAKFLKNGDYDRAVAAASALARRPDAEPWTFQTLAGALKLAGAEKEVVRRAALSIVDLRPGDLAFVLTAAQTLAEIGDPASALELLHNNVEIFPGSINVYYLALRLAEQAEDVDAVVWAADGLCGRTWMRDANFVAKDTGVKLDRIESKWRSKGRTGDADRLAKIRKQPREQDVEVTLAWQGEADLDLVVIEPRGFVCSPASPRTIGGGVLSADQAVGSERYCAEAGFAGDFELRVKPIWGAPVGKVATVDVRLHAGSPREKRERFTVKLDGDSQPIKISLDKGRRTEIVALSPDEGLWGRPAPVVERPRAQLRELVGKDKIPSEAFAQAAAPAPGLGGAFLGAATVAYQPIVANVLNGVTMQAQAVVSADRRYVRLQMIPVLQNIAGSKTFQVTGAAR